MLTLQEEINDSINWKCSVKLEDTVYHRDNYPTLDIEGKEYADKCYKDACEDLLECLNDDSLCHPSIRGTFPFDTKYNDLYYASYYEKFGKKGIKQGIKLINNKL
ncbi:MAG: hypothetical protein ACUZ8E_18055 [Candidatus Anammoxibacter sp.]